MMFITAHVCSDSVKFPSRACESTTGWENTVDLLSEVLKTTTRREATQQLALQTRSMLRQNVSPFSFIDATADGGATGM